MNTSTEHVLQCDQSEPLADASGKIVDLMNENGPCCALKQRRSLYAILCLISSQCICFKEVSRDQISFFDI